jgi:HK97 family phage portal protein/HK97 family phage prohead protease
MAWYHRFMPGTSRKSDPLQALLDLYGGRITKSGKSVNFRTALEVSAVLACARVIAHGLAQVPLKIFKDDGIKRLPAPDHPLYRLIHLRPNPFQTSFEFLETLGLHVVLAGNAYVLKVYGVGGRLIELLPLDPMNTRAIRAPDWTVTYQTTLQNGEAVTLPADKVWHVKGTAWCTWVGLEAVQLAREAIGLAIATEESHASLHRNGIQTTGAYSVDGTLTDAQYVALAGFLKKWQSSENAGTPMILDRNAKWISTMMSGVDAQHLETRKYQVEDICRQLGVLPIMVGHSDKSATYASAEQMFLAHVVHTMVPWYRRFEQSILVGLMSEQDEKDGYYPKFIEQGLLRGSLEATKTYLTGLVQWGVMTRNEAREVLELNRLDGLDEPLTPVNMAVGADPAPESDMQGNQKSARDMDRFDCGLIEFKLAGDKPEEMLFTGYGAVFGNVDSYGDVIQKGAFAKSIAEAKSSGQWPAMLLQHGGFGLSADDMMPAGLWTDIEEDDHGLKLTGKMAPTQRGRDAYALLKMDPRPAITGLSIGFIPVKWRMKSAPDEPRRTLEEVRLMEVSLVTFPANAKARIQSVKNEITKRTLETALRDAGCTQGEAKRILAEGFKAMPAQRDVGGLEDIAASLRRNIQSLK